MGRIFKVTCQTKSDCQAIFQAVTSKEYECKASINGNVITIDTYDNDPKDIKSLVDRMPFKTNLIEESKLSKMINRIIKEEVRKVRLKESSSQQEIEDIAVDLIDYMGKELPPRPNQRIMRWFQESGITNQNIMKQIYLRALQLNVE